MPFVAKLLFYCLLRSTKEIPKVQTIIVYVDDAAHAQPLIAAALQESGAASAHWLLVACAPRITHRVSRFVSNRTRENWRNKWAQNLFEGLQPVLQGKVAKFSNVLARGPLQDLLGSWQAEHGAALQLMDLRRPKVGDAVVLEQVQPQPSGASVLRQITGSITGIGAIWTVLAGEVLAA